MALGAAVAAGDLNACRLAANGKPCGFRRQALASSDRLGQGLASAAARLLSPRFVDFVGPLGRVGKDEHLVTSDLQKAAADRHRLLAAASLDPDDARLERGQQRRMSGQDAHDALGTRRHDHIDGLFGEHFTLGSDDLHAQRHTYRIARSRVRAFARTREYVISAQTLTSPMATRLHYAWVVAGVTFLALLASAGINATRAVLVLPLEREFGWDRAAISLALSINLLLFGLCGPFAGALMARFGVRRVMLVALSTLAVGVGLSALMTNVWQLIGLWGILVGAGSGSMALVLGATVATRWFVKRRGLITGIFAASTATGQLIFLPEQAALVEAAGWRTAVVLVAAVALSVAALVAVLMRDDPRQKGLQPYGVEGESTPGSAAVPARGNPFGLAVDTLVECAARRDFWLLAGSFAICGATTVGLIAVHLIPASVEHGLTEVTAAGMLAAMGVFDLVGTTLSGWLSDRWDPRKLLVWYYTLRGIALLFLPAAYDAGVPALAAFVVFYGLDWVATVPPTVRLVADRFGKERVGPVFGWVFAAHQLGGSVAAFSAGALHTWLGDYLVAFVTAGVLCLLAAGLIVGLNRPTAPALILRPLATDH